MQVCLSLLLLALAGIALRRCGDSAKVCSFAFRFIDKLNLVLGLLHYVSSFVMTTDIEDAKRFVSQARPLFLQLSRPLDERQREHRDMDPASLWLTMVIFRDALSYRRAL